MKPGSVVVNSSETAGESALVPAAAPGEREWGFGSLYCREAQVAATLRVAVHAGSAERAIREGSFTTNVSIYRDDEGTGGWAEIAVPIASSLWVAVSGILIPG